MGRLSVVPCYLEGYLVVSVSLLGSLALESGSSLILYVYIPT
jgi:hypothetical protein